MHESDALGRVGELQHPIERGVTAAENDEPLAGELRRVAHAVVYRLVFVLLDVGHAQRTRLERAHAGRDHDSLRIELRARAGLDKKRIVILSLHDLNFLAEMHPGRKRLDLLQERLRQFLARAHRHGGNIVNRLVRVKLGALSTGIADRIDDLGLEAEQAEFEYLEQPARASPNDDNVCRDHSILLVSGVHPTDLSPRINTQLAIQSAYPVSST